MNIPRILAYLRPGTTWSTVGPRYEDLRWLDPSPAPTAAELAAAELPAEKVARVDAYKTAASRRILARWPDFAQRNAALGVYDDLPASDDYNPATMRDGIKAVIAEVHAAEAAISALTSVEAVQAYPLEPAP